MNNIRIYKPTKAFENDNMTYLEMLINVVKATDSENWKYFAQDDAGIIKEFLMHGRLSRILALDQSDGKSIPVAYIQLKLLHPLSPSLFKADFYHKLGISSENLFISLSELDQDTPLYIDVVAIKKDYQNNIRLLLKMAEAAKEIINSLDYLPREIFAVAVSEAGRKLCRMFGNQNDCSISSVKRVELLEGEETTHIRELYRYDSEYLLNRLANLKK